MSLFAPAPEPKTELGRYRLLSPSCGLRVSPLCLGGMSFGEAWKDFMGAMDKEQTFKLLDAYYEAGGNFVDTANNYQNEESELWIGEWMEKRGVRDEMVIATKFTTGYKAGSKKIAVNYSGNHIKSMRTSVRDSLAKLKTDHIDLLWMHWYDWCTPVEEVMQGLNDLVRSGKVHYLGISDTPAWWVSAANMYARQNGMAQFVVYQGRWNVVDRDVEREILPLIRYWGMGITPWNAIGGGKFQSKKQLEERQKSGEGLRSFRGSEQTESERKASEALEKVAGELGTESVTAVALAYVMSKVPYCFPIVGGRKIEHLHANIEALKLKLSEEQIKELESVVPFELGFPMNFVGTDPHTNGGEASFLTKMNGNYAFVQGPQAISHT